MSKESVDGITLMMCSYFISMPISSEKFSLSSRFIIDPEGTMYCIVRLTDALILPRKEHYTQRLERNFDGKISVPLSCPLIDR
jgi:hypothetical protein